MSVSVKYAILDTDFVSKANIIKNHDSVLADEVLSFPNYCFLCHKKMKDELGEHGTRAAQDWLENKISEGSIKCYDDKDIIAELSEAVGNNAYLYYRSFLKSGCDMIRSDYYTGYFGELEKWLEGRNYDEDGFLSVLTSCESKVGHQNSYGEVKAFVLLKTISFVYSADAYIFCSDDFGARQGFANAELIPCISILSVFVKLWLMGKKYEEAQTYYQSFVDWCKNRKNPQVSVRIWAYENGSDKRIRVSVETLLDDIYAGKYQARLDGDLQRNDK